MWYVYHIFCLLFEKVESVDVSDGSVMSS